MKHSTRTTRTSKRRQVRKTSFCYQYRRLLEARGLILPVVKTLRDDKAAERFEKAWDILTDLKPRAGDDDKTEKSLCLSDDEVHWAANEISNSLPYMTQSTTEGNEDARLSWLAFREGALPGRKTTLNDLVDDYLAEHPEYDAEAKQTIRNVASWAIDPSTGFLDVADDERSYKGEMQRGIPAFCSKYQIDQSAFNDALAALKAMPVESDKAHGGVGCDDLFDFWQYRFEHAGDKGEDELSTVARAILESSTGMQLLAYSGDDPEHALDRLSLVLQREKEEVRHALREIATVYPAPLSRLELPGHAGRLSEPTLTIIENSGKLGVNFSSAGYSSPKFVSLKSADLDGMTTEEKKLNKSMAEACRIIVNRLALRDQTKELIRRAIEDLIQDWTLEQLSRRCLTFRMVAEKATEIARYQGDLNRSVWFQNVQAITSRWDVRMPSGIICDLRTCLFSKKGKHVRDSCGFNVRQSAYEAAVLSYIARAPGASARQVAEELREEGIIVSVRKVNKDMLMLIDKLVQKRLAKRPAATSKDLEGYLERMGFHLTPSRRERIVAAASKQAQQMPS